MERAGIVGGPGKSPKPIIRRVGTNEGGGRWYRKIPLNLIDFFNF